MRVCRDGFSRVKVTGFRGAKTRRPGVGKHTAEDGLEAGGYEPS